MKSLKDSMFTSLALNNSQKLAVIGGTGHTNTTITTTDLNTGEVSCDGHKCDVVNNMQ